MATRGTAHTIEYWAFDTTAKTGKTGDVANHTLRWIKDGVSAAPFNAPAEVDATNCPGLYKLALTAAECTCDRGVLHGKSSTANVVIAPSPESFESAKIDLIGSATMAVTAPIVNAKGKFTVVKNADYLNADGMAITLTVTGMPSLAGASAVLTLWTKTSTVTRNHVTITQVGSDWQLKFELPRAIGATLDEGEHNWEVKISLASTNVLKPIRGVYNVLPSKAP